MNSTTRRYPRTLAEAWPRDHAAAIERPPRTTLRLRDMALIAVTVVFALGALAYKFAGPA